MKANIEKLTGYYWKNNKNNISQYIAIRFSCIVTPLLPSQTYCVGSAGYYRSITSRVILSPISIAFTVIFHLVFQHWTRLFRLWVNRVTRMHRLPWSLLLQTQSPNPRLPRFYPAVQSRAHTHVQTAKRASRMLGTSNAISKCIMGNTDHTSATCA